MLLEAESPAYGDGSTLRAHCPNGGVRRLGQVANIGLVDGRLRGGAACLVDINLIAIRIPWKSNSSTSTLANEAVTIWFFSKHIREL